ncbi:STAS domain-containing protein [Nonomuraea sp. PA05]|uniref:STAS domain-containing protein n=1 Tax=Nonomuraea sp. PA05 TaxID=2604466 RepID=UPI0011D30905|nr:STAS domain-containing protein [Nonomuraea sp. PA05]TYB70172.1 STAS domain-containing protein [Nonomuraea sp. PA05]
MDPLHLTTSRHNGTLMVSVAGELDIATTELLRSHLLALLQEAGHSQAPGTELVIEVSRLSFIDAAGLGILVSVQNQAAHQHTPLHIEGVPPNMRRLLRITGLDQHLT